MLLICALPLQEGKTAAMIALEGPNRWHDYICFLLLVEARVDLKGVDLYHKSKVSFYFASIFLLPTLPTLAYLSLHYLVLRPFFFSWPSAEKSSPFL